MTDFPDTLNASILANIVGGQLTGNPDASVLRARADSRLCSEGDLYVALPGTRVDGANFVSSAWKNGAKVALVKKSVRGLVSPKGKALVQVDDALSALQRLAAACRRALPSTKVIGITGSNGKTTVKNILGAILRSWKNGNFLVSEKNFNSDIGLPLTLISLRPCHEIAILEMGINRIGEMALLSEIALPDIAVITNIGRAHVGSIGNVEGIAREKRDILSNMDSSGVAVIGHSEIWKEVLLENFSGNVRFFGEWGLNGWDSYKSRNDGGFVVSRYGQEVNFFLPGLHNMANAMAAVEVALELGVPESAIQAGLESVRAEPGRLEIVRDEITVIRDYYNASPESLKAALNVFGEMTFSGRHILVLGELLELGDETEKALDDASKDICAVNPAAVFLYGSSVQVVKDMLVQRAFPGEIKGFTEMERLQQSLADYVLPGDGVLLKGSRGSALERLDISLQGIVVG